MKTPRTALTLIAFSSLILVGACQTASSPPATTVASNDQAERYKEAYRKIIEVGINQGDTTIVDSVIAENPIEHQAMPPGVPPGRAGLKQFIVMYRAAFPDVKIVIEDVMVEGDRLMAYTVMTGTHTGEFMGIKPTGKPVRVEGFDRVRFDGDMMAEHWAVNDDAGLMRQIGATP